MSQKKLEGRIALVTGASRGIGYAVAKQFASEGAHVIATARTVGGLEELDDEIRAAGGVCTLAPIDLRKGEEIDALGYSLYERFGKLDILVGNAGVLGGLSPVSHLDPKDWDHVMAVNATANYRLLRSLDSLLRSSDAGRAIFVTSRLAHDCKQYWSGYAASKAALESLVKVYAAEVEKITSVRANLISPGPIATALRAKAYPGEDPTTLPKPADIVGTFVEMAEAGFDKSGEIIEI
ncbi:SDR family NAD(P)-dependent oxidoreductase [Aestuariispira ectoiniformans]|uniref:SDR family NAD(P)-dependent oxidoreductase n=1 Tax=Aestuariispira ectoiniformans TaxID=2775080 RepID=UPI00223AB72B|nr:SDR family NAD(P)-dependent oxidoreductase [Aestuariispira ectoiniformans]